jgi:hypothetical protein
MAITVLDPTLEPTARTARTAPRLPSLAGATVALLDNGKINADRFLDHVEDILRTGHGVRAVVRRRKPNASAPAPDDVLRELAGCDALVSAVGD